MLKRLYIIILFCLFSLALLLLLIGAFLWWFISGKSLIRAFDKLSELMNKAKR